jgi:hypothetical protein
VHASLETADIARRLNRPFAYVFTFVPASGQDEPKMREHLEDAGFAVAPKGLGDRRREYADAIADGSTVQEIRPNSTSANEVKACEQIRSITIMERTSQQAFFREAIDLAFHRARVQVLGRAGAGREGEAREVGEGRTKKATESAP